MMPCMLHNLNITMTFIFLKHIQFYYSFYNHKELHTFFRYTIKQELTFTSLNIFLISSSETSNGKLPIKAVNGLTVGTLLRSTSAPRADLGAVGRADKLITTREVLSSSSAKINTAMYTYFLTSVGSKFY